jgi:hypothetical protein
MYVPEFPYKGKQIIVSSGRVIVHAKNDSVFLLGKKNVGISSGGEVHIDANAEVYIDAPKISLGNKVTPDTMVGMEPVLLGYQTNQILIRLSETLIELGDALGKVSESNLPASMQLLASTGPLVSKNAKAINNQVTGGGTNPREAFNLSKVVYTK